MNPGGLYGKARPENFPEINDYRNPIIAQALKVMGYVNMFNRGVSRVKSMMLENGNKEPIFNIDKITAFEVISFTAIKHVDLPVSTDDFPKSFPKLIDKLIPVYFQEEDKEMIEVILSSLIEPKSVKDIAKLTSYSTRTIKDKYLNKMLQAEVVIMTIPDKPTSSKQKYKLKTE